MKTTKDVIPVNWHKKKRIPEQQKHLRNVNENTVCIFSLKLFDFVFDSSSFFFTISCNSSVISKLSPLYHCRAALASSCNTKGRMMMMKVNTACAYLLPLLYQPVWRLLYTSNDHTHEDWLGAEDPAHCPPVHQVPQQVGLGG
jgi:hypothetical protein